MIATLWTLVWHFGIGGVGIAGALAFAWFSPVFKKTALWVALSIALVLGSYATGVVNENSYWQAKWDAAQVKAVKRGTTARARAGADAASGVRDDRDTDD